MSDFIHEKIFYDTVNYPHGFSRSGEYTIRESKVLEEFGTRLQLLTDGVKQPETDAEQQFVKVVKGELEPETFIEKTWLKYTRLIQEVKRVYILADNISMTSLSEDDID